MKRNEVKLGYIRGDFFFARVALVDVDVEYLSLLERVADEVTSGGFVHSGARIRIRSETAHEEVLVQRGGNGAAAERRQPVQLKRGQNESKVRGNDASRSERNVHTSTRTVRCTYMYEYEYEYECNVNMGLVR